MKPIKLTRFIDGGVIFVNPDMIVAFALDPNYEGLRDMGVTRVWLVGDSKDDGVAVRETPERVAQLCDPNSMAVFEPQKAAA
jgi:hypothetical protein